MNLQERLRRSISRRRGSIVLRSELARCDSTSHVGRALRSLQDQGVLVRIGTGVYAKTRKSSITGAMIPAGSLETLAMEAFRKLGVKVSPASHAVAYNNASTTQLPGSFVANTGRRRITRRIAIGGRAVVYENNYSTARRA